MGNLVSNLVVNDWDDEWFYVYVVEVLNFEFKGLRLMILSLFINNGLNFFLGGD